MRRMIDVMQAIFQLKGVARYPHDRYRELMDEVKLKTG